jgi:hypothetical protein
MGVMSPRNQPDGPAFGNGKIIPRLVIERHNQSIQARFAAGLVQASRGATLKVRANV